MRTDGTVGLHGDSPTDPEARLWEITPPDGEMDDLRVLHMNEAGDPVVNKVDDSADGVFDTFEVWLYDDTLGYELSYMLYRDAMLETEQYHSMYTNEDTPLGGYYAQKIESHTAVEHPVPDCTYTFTPGVLQGTCIYYFAGATYYRQESRFEHIDGIYTSGWTNTTLLEGYFGSEDEYSSSEYFYDALGRLEELRTINHQSTSTNTVTKWFSDEETDQIIRKEVTRDGHELLSSVDYTYRDDRTELVEFDENGDGEIDLVKTARHEDGILLEYREERLVGEVGLDEIPPLHLLIAEYDETQTLVKYEMDWDGDGISDQFKYRSVSCTEEDHGYDPDDFDHDRDGYSVTDGDCDDNDPSLTPDSGC